MDEAAESQAMGVVAVREAGDDRQWDDEAAARLWLDAALAAGVPGVTGGEEVISSLGPRPVVAVRRQLAFATEHDRWELDYGDGQGSRVTAVPLRDGAVLAPDGLPVVRRSLQRFSYAGEALFRFELVRALLGHESRMRSADLLRLREVPWLAEALAVHAGFEALAGLDADARAGSVDAQLPDPVRPVLTAHGVIHRTCTGGTVISVMPPAHGDGAVLSVERYAPLDLASRQPDRDRALAVITGYCGEPFGLWRDEDERLQRVLADIAHHALPRLRDRGEYPQSYLSGASAWDLARAYLPDEEAWASEAAWLEAWQARQAATGTRTDVRRGLPCSKPGCGHKPHRHDEAGPCADCGCRQYASSAPPQAPAGESADGQPGGDPLAARERLLEGGGPGQVSPDET